MSGTTTPNFGLNLPTVGASRDTWGSLLNQNMTTIDTFLGYACPIGVILDFAGPNAPPGWLICDGRLISRATYAALFAIIGTYWGTGDGSTTFALPPTPGRCSVGPGATTDSNGNALNFTFATLDGAAFEPIGLTNLPAITLTSDTFAAHAHSGTTAPGANHTHTIDQQGLHSHPGSYTANHTHPVNGQTDAQGSHAHNVTIPNSGTGAAFGGNAVTGPVFGNTNVVTDVQGLHQHNISFNSGGSGNTGVVIYGDGLHAHNAAYSGNLFLGIYADGAHSHQVPLGGGGNQLRILNPLLVCTKIIYAGSQAAAAALTSAPQRRRLSAPLRGGVRQIAGH
jgi:microcystin-dependent protein